MHDPPIEFDKNGANNRLGVLLDFSTGDVQIARYWANCAAFDIVEDKPDINSHTRCKIERS